MRILLLFIALVYVPITYSQNVTIKVLDTDFSKGRLTHQQSINLEDAAKFHGHLCDGLAVGFLGIKEALYKLYSDSIIDRTNTRVVSKSSPCITDIAIYLTGGRYQFNTFYVSDSIYYLYIVQRIDNKKTYGVRLRSGIKPSAIDSLGNLATAGKLDACTLDFLKDLETAFLNILLTSEPAETFIVEEIQNFDWKSPFIKSYIKTDIINKHQKKCKKGV